MSQRFSIPVKDTPEDVLNMPVKTPEERAARDAALQKHVAETETVTVDVPRKVEDQGPKAVEAFYQAEKQRVQAAASGASPKKKGA